MQKKITFQLPSISLSKTSVFFVMLFSLSACSSSDDSSTTEDTPGKNTSESDTNETTSVPLSTALNNFKTVAADAGLTAE